MEIKTICYFGIYKSDYSRNRILIKGFRENGINVLECSSQKTGFYKYIELFKRHWLLRGQYDLIFVGFPGYQAVVLAWILSTKPIIFDAFCSLYNTAVEDRKTVTPSSMKARYYWFLDWLSCTLSNVVVLDTNANINYFIKNFMISHKKFLRVFVGTDSTVFYPTPEQKYDSFIVHFHGHFIPLQGVEYVIQAANLLKDENIRFQIIGLGQEYDRIRKQAEDLGLKNITWIGNVPYESLQDYMSSANVCLGIFGNTSKTDIVIPNKVFEALACGRPVITADTPAIRELLTDKENVFLCKKADPADLAESIRVLQKDINLRSHIAEAGYSLFTNKLMEKSLASGIIFKHESKLL